MDDILAKYHKLIEELPESDQPEFYQILADESLTTSEKELLLLDRLNLILPRDDSNE